MFRQYYSSEAPEGLLEKPNVLSAICFNTDCAAPNSAGLIPVGLESLSEYTCEIIEGHGEVKRGIDGNCYWSHDGETICSAIWIANEDCNAIESSTKASYLALMEHLRKMGFPHPFRFWNYIPQINHGPGDLEEYKKFCNGRLTAFRELGIADSQFPAASALGHHAKGAVIYVLASRKAGKHYENPRQESAYHYPRQYGPSSPSFARATSVSIADGHWAFISGTASILGHETKSPGDILQQTEITVDNIELLAKHIEDSFKALDTLKVYLRHKSDLEITRNYLSKRLPFVKIIYTCADVCRANLLVEIEANFPFHEL